MDQGIVQLRLRLPAELVDYIRAAAAEDHRSINSEVIVLLEEARKAREAR